MIGEDISEPVGLQPARLFVHAAFARFMPAVMASR